MFYAEQSLQAGFRSEGDRLYAFDTRVERASWVAESPDDRHEVSASDAEFHYGSRLASKFHTPDFEWVVPRSGIDEFGRDYLTPRDGYAGCGSY